jgi:hypothetical protein
MVASIALRAAICSTAASAIGDIVLRICLTKRRRKWRPAGHEHRLPLMGGFAPFLRGIENALGNLDVLQWQVALIGAQLLGFGTELIAPEFADHFEPALRRFRLCERCLMIGNHFDAVRRTQCVGRQCARAVHGQA